MRCVRVGYGFDHGVFLFAVLGGMLALSSAISPRAYWRINPTPPDLLERVQKAFVTATHSDPVKTPELISLRGVTGLKTFLPTKMPNMITVFFTTVMWCFSLA
jgi:hypothetical protein